MLIEDTPPFGAGKKTTDFPDVLIVISEEAKRPSPQRTKSLRANGLTQQQIATQLGVSLATAYRDKDSQKQRGHVKNEKPRQDTRLKLSRSTKPETAAAKLRERFGETWCRELGGQQVSLFTQRAYGRSARRSLPQPLARA